MNTVWIAASFLLGVFLGALFFGGLWLSVRQLARTQHPALLMLLSFVARSAVVLSGFYFATGGRWERLLACLLGFLLSRLVLVRHLRTAAPTNPL